MDSADAQHLAANRSVGSFKRFLTRYTTVFSSRKTLTDQQQALVIVIVFMIITAAFAAIIKQW